MMEQQQQQSQEPQRKKVISRNKGFVRPNCSTTFWLYCPVCCRKYFKYDSHRECFKRWCEICQDALPTVDEFQSHAKKYHRKSYCDECQEVFTNLRGHKTFKHKRNDKRNNLKGTNKT